MANRDMPEAQEGGFSSRGQKIPFGERLRIGGSRVNQRACGRTGAEVADTRESLRHLEAFIQETSLVQGSGLGHSIPVTFPVPSELAWSS